LTKWNLHIFNDSLGVFTTKTVQFSEKISTNNYYLNLNNNCRTKHEKVSYSNLKKFITNNQNIQLSKVIYHSFHVYNTKEIDILKKHYNKNSIQFIWIFWGFEYYQLPHKLKGKYLKFSKPFYYRKLISFHYNYFIYFLKNKVKYPFYLGKESFEKYFNEFDIFCSFIKGDYNEVMKHNPNVQYIQLAYLSLNDFPNITLDFNRVKKNIMVGHAGSPILNHYEIILLLKKLKVKNKIIIPLSYGKKAYIRLLKKAIEGLKINNIEFVTDFMRLEDYYNKLDEIGIFILNSKRQEALGNIVFLLWNGTKIFLSDKSSTYKTLKELGYHIYSIENDLNAFTLEPLSEKEKYHNHKLISETLNPKKVEQGWRNILKE